MSRILTLLLALLAVPHALAQDLRTLSLRRVGDISSFVGYANFAVADLDGDNVAEIVSCSGGGAPLAVSKSGAAWATTWLGPASRCRAVDVGDRRGDGAREVIVVTDEYPAKLRIFDSRSLSPSRAGVTLPVGDATDIAFGNVDADAGNEIVVLTVSNTYVYNAATLQLEWTASGYGGWELALGDVDGDGRRDIVITGSTGWVLDAQQQNLKFGYLGGFGSKLAVADVDNDAKAEIVFAESWSSTYSILQGDTMQESSFNTGDLIDTVTVGDANADGTVEIITGNNQWGAVAGYRASDGVFLWDIDNPEHGVQGIIAADVTGDGKAEVIWGAGHSSTGKDALFIGNAVTETILWESDQLLGSFSSAVGDLDGDGRLEYVVASKTVVDFPSGGRIEIFDLETGASKGTLSVEPQSFFQVFGIAIGQADADPAKEVIAHGELWNDHQILVWDGVTKQRDFTSSSDVGGYAGFLVANIDGDAIDEIIVTGTDSQVLVLNGGSNVIQGSLNVSGIIYALAIADLNNDQILDLVIGTTSNTYSYKTSDWSQQANVNEPAQDLAATSAGGGTVAAHWGSTLRTYHGATLTSGWTCSSSATSLAFGTLGGETHLFAGDENGNIKRRSIAGTSCPTSATTAVTQSIIAQMSFRDVTGDGRVDLLLDTERASEIELVGLSSETRGDTDGSGFIDAADIDAVADYLFGAEAGLSTSGDANDDGRIGVEDIFQLIHYEFAGGPAPTP